MYRLAGYTIVKDDEYVSVKEAEELLQKLSAIKLKNTSLATMSEIKEVTIRDLRSEAESYEIAIHEQKKAIQAMEISAHEKTMKHAESSANFMKHVAEKQKEERFNKVMLVFLSSIMFGLGMIAA